MREYFKNDIEPLLVRYESLRVESKQQLSLDASSGGGGYDDDEYDWTQRGSSLLSTPRKDQVINYALIVQLTMRLALGDISTVPDTTAGTAPFCFYNSTLRLLHYFHFFVLIFLSCFLKASRF